MNSEMNSYRAWKAGSKRGSSLSLSLWIFSAGNRGAPRLYSPAKRITSSEWCPLLNPFRHYCYTLQFSRQDLRRTGILSRLSRRRPERNAARKRKRPKERERERERERDENAFAYEIKWRIYTVRSQYTYVRPTVNYTVNPGVLFERGGVGGGEGEIGARARAREGPDEDEG